MNSTSDGFLFPLLLIFYYICDKYLTLVHNYKITYFKAMSEEIWSNSQWMSDIVVVFMLGWNSVLRKINVMVIIFHPQMPVKDNYFMNINVNIGR